MAFNWHSTILPTGGRLTEGALGRRVIAYIIDLMVIGLLALAFKITIGILGIVTFGLAWFAFAIPGLVIAVAYSALSIASPTQGTLGMRAAGLRLVLMRNGGTVPLAHAAVHALLFYMETVSFLFLLDIACGLWRSDSRLGRDLIVGVVAIRS